MGEDDKLPLFFDADLGIYGSAENDMQELSEDEMRVPVYYTSGTFPWQFQKHTYVEPVHRSEIHYLHPSPQNKGTPGLAKTIVYIKRKNPKYSMMNQIRDAITEDNLRLRAEIERLKGELAQAKNTANVASTNLGKAMSEAQKNFDPKRNTNDNPLFTPGGYALPIRRY